MASYLKSLSPIPSFPAFTGPYSVGTTDVEIPVSELNSSGSIADESIHTIQFRVFYPCEVDAKVTNGINWIPKPQRGYVSAYTRFLGAGTTLAGLIAYFGSLLHYISIPSLKNAPLLSPNTKSTRWPVMIFSHGLGGTRNAYSSLAGSVASHGVIVICPEHRDGSAPISYMRNIPETKLSKNTSKRTVDYLKLSHTPSPEVEGGRNTQLRVRLWEMGLIHDALLKIDQGANLTNLNKSSGTTLAVFEKKLDVHEPGKITFAGHSFGGATVVQFVKSVFYAEDNSSAPKNYEPLYTPELDSPIRKQITPNTPVALLDVWCLPLRAESTRWLWDKPMPCYTLNGPGGNALLAVESQSFYVWKEHFRTTKQLLSPNPSSEEYNYKNGVSEPHFFYPAKSAHLSQSDFGILFPWMTKKVFAAEEPERVMRLNVRAILQLMRLCNIEAGETSAKDMEISEDATAEITGNDEAIFKKEGGVRGWFFLTTDLGDMGDKKEDSGVSGKADPSEAIVGGELMKENKDTVGGESEKKDSGVEVGGVKVV